MSAEKKAEKVEAPWDEQVERDRDFMESEARARHVALAALRKPFPPEAIGKLPRGNVSLDYAGHAAVTDRLLSVDPEWNWEPLGWDGSLPLFILSNGKPVGLWIKLTVLGVTRLGFGSVMPNAFDAEKQLIGDALRNAAMRFGVALELWGKAELESNVAPAVVDKQTGEIIPPTSRDEGDRMAEEIASWEPTTAPKARTVEGIPIHTTKDWKAVATLPLGGKNPYASMPLGKVIAQDVGDDREALDYFEGTAVRAVLDLWNRMTPAKKAGGVGLQNECVLLAYRELLDRRSPPPADMGRADL